MKYSLWSIGVGLVLTTSSCYATHRMPSSEYESDGITLLIENESFDQWKLRLNGRLLATVELGETCVTINRINPLGFGHFTFEKVIGRGTFNTDNVVMDRSPGWYVRIGNTPQLDLMSLRPAEKCK